MRCSAPGNIQAAALPSLRNLVVIDDMPDHREYLEEIGDAKCAIDFREMLVWREDGTEQRRVKELVDSHRSDEVINLQFTRYVSRPMKKPMYLCDCRQWNDRQTEGRVVDSPEYLK